MKRLVCTKGYWALLVLALASVFFLRVAGADSPLGLNWIERQSLDEAVAYTNGAVQYLCIKGTVYDLGEGGPINPMEHTLILDSRAFKEKCIVPYISDIEGTRTLVVATAPKSGYAASLMMFKTHPDEVMESISKRFKRERWRVISPRPGSSPKPKGLMLEKRNAWLLVTVASFDPEAEETKVLLAGNFFHERGGE